MRGDDPRLTIRAPFFVCDEQTRVGRIRLPSGTAYTLQAVGDEPVVTLFAQALRA